MFGRKSVDVAAVAIFQRTGKPDAAIYRKSSEGEGKKTHQKQMDDIAEKGYVSELCFGLVQAVKFRKPQHP